MEHLVDNVFYSHASIFQLTWQRFEGELFCVKKKKMELLCQETNAVGMTR